MSSKINFSLTKKKSSSKKRPLLVSAADFEEEEKQSVAQAASLETKRRKEEGVSLVIPCSKHRNGSDEKSQNEPLLSSYQRIVTGKDSSTRTDQQQTHANEGKEKSSPSNGEHEELSEAEKALMKSAADHAEGIRENGDTNFSSRGNLVIEQTAASSKRNINVNDKGAPVDDDTLKYQRDLAHRAENLSVESDAYVQVPISEFGAAMLRGMGWTGSDTNQNKKKTDDESKPRPTRLGLGAVSLPKSKLKGEQGKKHYAKRGGMMSDIQKKNDDADQERKWKERENEKKRLELQMDKKRKSRDDGRQDQKSKKYTERDRERSRNDDERGDDRKRSRRSRRDEDEHKHRRSKDSRKESKTRTEECHWIIPNIRVRVISKKISKGKYFKEKGVIVDVLRRGAEAVIQMPNRVVLERVPERYLETALPKPGGNVIILTGSHKLEKGKLLERNGKEGKGAVQLFEDMNIVSLSLDDIAEWCGPLDDDL